MALEYVPGKTIFHKLDPRAKLVWMSVVLTLASMFLDPIFIVVVLFSVYTSIWVAKVPWEKIKQLYRPLIPTYCLYFILSLWWYRGPTVFFSLFGGFLVVTLEGIVYSLANILRFTCIITIVRVVTLITAISDFIIGLVRLRLPKEFGMALSIGLGYVPVLMEQTLSIMNAQRARAWRFEYRNPIKRGRALLAVLFPALFMSMYRGTKIAAAIESKGFGYDIAHRTYRRQLKYEMRDYAFTIICVIALVVGGVMTWYHLAEFDNTVSLLKQLFRL